MARLARGHTPESRWRGQAGDKRLGRTLFNRETGGGRHALGHFLPPPPGSCLHG